MGEWMVTVGDCRDVLAGLEPESVDAVVCDPPYELSFMGKGWDGTGIAYDVGMWAEVLRVLKPGGHLLAFGGTRTFHRMTVAIEDAGFEVRDCLSWLYGSGFPKSLNVGKAIDKANGRKFEDRYALGRHIRERREASGVTRAEVNGWFGYRDGCEHWERQDAHGARVPTMADWLLLRDRLTLSDEWHELVARVEAEREVVGTKMSGIANKAEGPRHTIGASKAVEVDVTTAATDEARRWEGWGTALKPAWEPIVMARKRLVGTVAGNVLAHGTGGLNIDGSRIAHGNDVNLDAVQRKGSDSSEHTVGWMQAGHVQPTYAPSGRWPANVLLDEGAAAALDEQTGVRTVKGGTYDYTNSDDPTTTFTSMNEGRRRQFTVPSETGGASRFYYVSKASRRDRNEGLDGMDERPTGEGGSPISNSKCVKCGLVRFAQPHCVCVEPEWDKTKTGTNANFHPTVKPTALMRHLVKLVTPPGGLVLDPFTGSGSTGKAAVLEGFRFHGIEQDAEYAEIARARIAWAEQQADEEPDQPTLM